MLRTILSSCATIALLVPLVGSAQAQEPRKPTELSQVLLDRALVALPEINKLAASPAAPASDDTARPHLERICTAAGFETTDQCGTIIGYVGILFSGFDPRTGTFVDPIVRMRKQIAQIEANARLAADEKDKMTTPLREIVATFPENMPEAHLRLMTTNRDRIFEAFGKLRKR